MSTHAVQRAASERQLQYIKRLCFEMGGALPELDRGMSSMEASQLIGELIGKRSDYGVSNVQRESVINEPRLGMAMKECFRIWTQWGWDIWNNAAKRASFTKEVIATYDLFTEIDERIRRTHSARQSGTSFFPVEKKPRIEGVDDGGGEFESNKKA